jgi:methyltransferase family protein
VAARHLLFNALTLIPGAARLPAIQSVLKRRALGTGGSISARYCYSVWLRHLVMAARHGLNVDPRHVTELGPGDSIGVGLAALACGAETYSAADFVAHAFAERDLHVLAEITDLLLKRTPVPDEQEFPRVEPRLEHYAFPSHILTEERMTAALAPGRLQRIRAAVAERGSEDSIIRYCAPWLGAGVIERASQDLVLSQAVLEHVDQLTEAYAAMREWLKPSGYMSHAIDFSSHESAWTWDGHWRYGDVRWKLARGKGLWSINREPYSTHAQLIRQSGFEIVCCVPTRSAPSFDRRAIAARFRDMPEDDRSISQAFVIAAPVRPPQAMASQART